MADQIAGSGKPVPPAKPAGSFDPDEVAAFLAAHPDFLLEHESLVPLIIPPSHRQGRNVVDLQDFMLRRLRDEVTRLKAQQKTLIATSRANLNSQQRVHNAALTVISARNFEQLLQIITTDLAVLLDVDVTTLCIESDESVRPPMPGIFLLEPGTVDHLLGLGRDALLEDHVHGDPAIFGGGAGLVQSEALLRLEIPKAPLGLLALGSRRPTKFRQGHGTELLSFLARTVGTTISQWLDL